MLVCTLPSPACMCSATQVRPRSTFLWMARHSSMMGANSAPAKICCSGASTCVFHEARSVSSWMRSKNVRAGSSPHRGLHDVQARASSRCHSARTSPTQRQRARDAIAQQLGRRDVLRVLALAQRQRAGGQEAVQRVEQRELVAQAQLDVDALDAQRVLAHALQRDHHVLVHLERVGVLGDGGGALAIEPELLARVGADGDEALARARVGHAHDLAGGARDGVLVGADDVAEQRHLGQAAALALGGVAHRAQVAVVQVLQAGQDRAAGQPGLREHEVLDLDDRRAPRPSGCRRTPGTRCARAPASCARPSARW